MSKERVCVAKRPTRWRQGGMTLLEVMVAVSIAAILLAVGVPSFMSTLRGNTLATQSNEVLAGLSLARVEALRQNRSVRWSYRPGTEPSWAVWRDQDADDVMDAGEVLREGPLSASVDVSGTASGFPHITYNPDGTLQGGSWGSIWMCMEGSAPYENVRRMVLIVSGRVRTERCACDRQCSGPSTECAASDCDDAA